MARLGRTGPGVFRGLSKRSPCTHALAANQNRFAPARTRSATIHPDRAAQPMCEYSRHPQMSRGEVQTQERRIRSGLLRLRQRASERMTDENARECLRISARVRKAFARVPRSSATSSLLALAQQFHQLSLQMQASPARPPPARREWALSSRRRDSLFQPPRAACREINTGVQSWTICYPSTLPLRRKGRSSSFWAGVERSCNGKCRPPTMKRR